MQQTKDNPIQGQAKKAIEVKPAEKPAEAAQPDVKAPGAPQLPADVPAVQLEPGKFPGQVPVAQPPPQEAKPKADVGDLLEPALWLVGALLLLALVFWLLRRWRQQEHKPDLVSEQLTRFRQSYEQGEMSEEEYRRVHTLLAGKMHDQMRPAPAAPPPAEARKPSGNGPDDSAR